MSVVLYSGNTLQAGRSGSNLLTDRLGGSLEQFSGKITFKSDPDVVPENSVCGTVGGTDCTVTIKLFLPAGVTPAKAAQATSEALKLFADQIGSVVVANQLIISLEGLKYSDDGDEADATISDKQVSDIWKAITSAAVSSEVSVSQFGISELSAPRLSALLGSLEAESPVRPALDQINADDCCALPPSLLSLSRQHGIRLVAHHDPEDILPNSELSKVLAPYVTSPVSWTWILRITKVANTRQVLTCNEYFVHVESS